MADFIEQTMEPILLEWGMFARTRIPAAATMNIVELRDHADEMLVAIVADLRRPQTESQRDVKAKGLALALSVDATAASTHGELRHLSGFTLIQVASEFRALRASILRLWGVEAGVLEAADVEALTRMNEGIDQALAESIAGYSAKIDESRDTFLAVLGHDLRGPLAALSNCVELNAGPPPPSAQRDRTTHIARRSIDTMRRMITDLLEYTRTRLGRGIEVMPLDGNLGSLCEECLEEIKIAYPGTPFEFSRQGDLAAQFDAARIQQVLTNLLANAIQHGDRISPIVFAVEADGPEVSIVVRNQGVAIPPEALQVIFNPLVQVAKAKSAPHERPSTSLGLGLFIAREIVVAHDGTIAVSSTPEAGTAFTVRLPRQIL